MSFNIPFRSLTLCRPVREISQLNSPANMGQQVYNRIDNTRTRIRTNEKKKEKRRNSRFLFCLVNRNLCHMMQARNAHRTGNGNFLFRFTLEHFPAMTELQIDRRFVRTLASQYRPIVRSWFRIFKKGEKKKDNETKKKNKIKRQGPIKPDASENNSLFLSFFPPSLATFFLHGTIHFRYLSMTHFPSPLIDKLSLPHPIYYNEIPRRFLPLTKPGLIRCSKL